MSLRPEKCESDRFFLNYQRNACTRQVIGKNKLSKMPQEIPEFLKLSNPECYTGHSFRRSSATLLADAGADLITIKQYGGWKSSNVAEGYIENSTTRKRKVGNLITSGIMPADTNSTIIHRPTPSTTTSTITSGALLSTNFPIPAITGGNSNIMPVSEAQLQNMPTIDIENQSVSYETRSLNLEAKHYPMLNIQNCANVNIYYKEG